MKAMSESYMNNYPLIEPPPTLDVQLTYPHSKEYEIHTRLIRLNLDEERESDIVSNKGFVVAPTQGIKKDIKNPFSIFSSKFGQTIKDVNPFGNRYRCDCGFTQNKVNNGTVCKICGTKVRYIDDDYQYFGWIVLQDYWVISPAFYKSLRYFIGKDFDSIIKYYALIDEDGHQLEAPKINDQPFFGIGLIEFRERFEEIMDYYLNKNKTPTKIEKYNDIMNEKEKVFTQSIPVFTVLLRPFDVDKYTFSHETTNKDYTIINKNVSSINRESAIAKSLSNDDDNRKKKTKIRKSIQEMLYNLQIKMDGLYTEVIDIIKGKKGNIRALFGGRYNYSSRNVIIADPTLRIDEVRLPYSALVELLQQSIVNILTKTYNLSYADAYRRWYEANLKKDPVIIDIINSLITHTTETGNGLPVLINRNPTISYGSILMMRCIGISDQQVLPLLAADFDYMVSGAIRNITNVVTYYSDIISLLSKLLGQAKAQKATA